ncbi:MAG: Tol-Pal system protein TolB [Hellea sp.]|nr:Tol-Pal system protein TolB [Hellea sp.]
MNLIRLIFLTFVLAMGTFNFAHAQLRIDITEGNLDPVPIAVVDFSSDRQDGQALGVEISEIIRADLERSGLFVSISPDKFQTTQTDLNYKPTFADWRVIKAEALLLGRVVIESPTRIRVEARLWDISSGEELAGIVFGTTPNQERRVAHKISDAIYEKLTGETGYFDSRIVFVSESGSKIEREKRLAIMDQDGANMMYLDTGRGMVLTPRFSPSSQRITYLSYESGKGHIYVYDIETGRRELLGNFPDMTFAPRFSPDGQSMILSLMRKGNSDLYAMDLSSRSTKRLTTSPAIDVSGSYSPDGEKIVFNSDRGGTPQLYVMNADGSSAKRISFGKGRYNSPVWSPRGDKIAFVKSRDGKFSIGVMNIDGSGERILAESYMYDVPTWSPNGRVIMFYQETRGEYGTSSLWSVDLTGRNLRKVSTPLGASDPAWSPLLP